MVGLGELQNVLKSKKPVIKHLIHVGCHAVCLDLGFQYWNLFWQYLSENQSVGLNVKENQNKDSFFSETKRNETKLKKKKIFF